MSPDRKLPVVEILLIEDSEDDAQLMQEALNEGSLKPRIVWVDNGEEALAYLRRQCQAPEPSLILLDLHLPRMNGYEVLAEIKEDALLRRIPIVIMTSENTEEIFRTAYDLRANCCVSKPADQEEFKIAVKKIEAFWLRVACRA